MNGTINGLFARVVNGRPLMRLRPPPAAGTSIRTPSTPLVVTARPIVVNVSVWAVAIDTQGSSDAAGRGRAHHNQLSFAAAVNFVSMPPRLSSASNPVLSTDFE